MKTINDVTSEIQSSGIQNERFFSIKQSNLAHVFGVLRNNLYSNKPGAIIREYSTNAYDAHAEAGYPGRPISVTLPTSLYPTLIIRDFGAGLSEDDVYDIFASYGESTKRGTNTQVGMLGLGSKSAFCYVNSFTVVSYFDGVRNVYEAFIDETGIGKISKVHNEPSDEETGVEISVTIKPSDISTFVNTAKEFYKHWNPKPIIKNSPDVARYLDSYVAASPILEGKDWKLIKNESGYGYNAELFVNMGNIRYPVQLSQLSGDAYSWASSLSKMELSIVIPIGSVNISASRESLEYSDKTKEYLNNSVVNVMKEVVSMVEKELAHAKTLWEARIILSEVSGRVGNLTIAPVWNGKSVTNMFITESVLKSLVKEDKLRLRDDRSYSAKQKWQKVGAIKPKRNMTIFVDKNDVPRNSVFGRINQEINEKGLGGELFLAQFDTAGEAVAFMTHEEIVGAKIVDISTITYVPPKRGSMGKDGSVRSKQYYAAFKFNANKAYEGVKSKAWDAEDIDVEDGEGVYIRIHSFMPTLTDTNVDTLTVLNDVLNHLQTLTGNTPTIYGFRTKVDGLGDGWHTMKEYVRDVLRDQLDDKNFQEIVLSKTVTDAASNYYLSLANKAKDFGHGKMGTYLSALRALRELSSVDRQKYGAFVNLCRLMDSNDLLPKQEADKYLKMEEDVDNKYPMVRVVKEMSSYSWNRYSTEICDYVNLVDSK